MRRLFAVGLVTVLAACGRAGDRADTTAAKADTGTAGMAGMSGTMNGAMMDSMHVRMSAMDTMKADGVKSMLPMHRQMMGNMLALMSREMQDMKMTGNPTWTALMDSVRQDLVRMPDLTAQQLKDFVAPHHGRVMRLMQAHRDMMKHM
jgi:hypothetical protein